MIVLSPTVRFENCSYEADDPFLIRLKQYDKALEAYRSYQPDEIILWATRAGGLKVHELTVSRETGEPWRAAEGRILKLLPEYDVWQRTGQNGKNFDNWLNDKYEDHRRKLRAKNKEERIARLRDDKDFVAAALREAKAGRFTADQVRPYKTPNNNIPIDLKKLEAEKAKEPEV